MNLIEAKTAITAMHDQVHAIIRDTEQDQRAGARAYWEYTLSVTAPERYEDGPAMNEAHDEAYGAWGRFFDAVGDLIETLKLVEQYAGEEDDRMASR